MKTWTLENLLIYDKQKSYPMTLLHFILRCSPRISCLGSVALHYEIHCNEESFGIFSRFIANPYANVNAVGILGMFYSEYWILNCDHSAVPKLWRFNFLQKKLIEVRLSLHFAEFIISIRTHTPHNSSSVDKNETANSSFSSVGYKRKYAA